MAKIQEVPTTDLGPSFDVEPLEEVHSNDDYNVFANEKQDPEQPVSIDSTCVVEKVGSNVIPDSSNMCDNEKQSDQNAKECDDERVVLANLIANLKLNTDQNKKIHKQLKKANTSLSYELQKCKSALEDYKSRIENYNRTRDTFIIALQTKEIELEKPQLKSTQMKEKDVQNNSQVKFKKTKVEDHHRISIIYNKTKSVTACNDSLKSKTSNVNVVCGKYVFNSNHDACVFKILDDVNARSKKPQEVPIRTRKLISKANQSVATSPKKTVASESII
nr:hypothetical protein [Tanacetum cinerariifolium]